MTRLQVVVFVSVDLKLLESSLPISAVVIDRPSASESEPVKECSTHMQQHTGICASTGTEQQSTGTNHDVAQSTSDDDIFDNTLYDDVCHFPKNYIPDNKRPILTHQQRLDRVEKRMRNMGMEIPTDVGDGYPHKMSTKAKERILEAKQKERRMSSSDKKKFRKLRLGRLWVCRKLALEPIEEESIRVVSEPTPELKSILKPGSTFKPHGSKHDHSKKHQQKSSHDAGSREAKVHFVPTTKIARYSSESSVLQEYDIQLPSLRSKFNRFKRQMLRFIGYRRHT
ncbi:hypothetical protein BATDEDRAFT_26084 [Batrachochytrium dendrobatidis JAM81]|uniref:Uncharacterized protein n=1 Tax=Batrachochytrium dendrobatidis (strain JAM81 / FGSC 10211) TaxID=684364 RepID=F4P6I6_BATDJ|nr:uncharacterized protein BATDEDRAFT_26084 [Batrachochytrium dendrobatidis JAM81]EGF79358.1 hypothetical protein BATDEDRAFT_26084 [Batrachochytrium dendrobatidis JAM81]|eukprot:XP_006679945.1 hypothetical protein BATDEDRAFT_26084 [Batrachochytrium dendrobatidis JAM81]